MMRIRPGSVLAFASALASALAFALALALPTAAQTITTIAGDGTHAFSPDGSRAATSSVALSLDSVSNVVVDPDGNLVFSEGNAARVRRIVKVSGGAPSLGPNAPTPTGVAHWRSEQRIESTGLDFCFLRPSFMMQNLLEAVAPLTAKLGILAAPFGNGQISMVDARDVAACAVVALTAEQSPDDAWQLTGPRAVSFADVADILGVPYFSVPRSIAERALRRRGLDDWEIDHSLRMTAYFAAR